MDWSSRLQPGEKLVWEGRPAPRCYVFRNWRHSLFGIMLLLLAAYWQWIGIELAAVYSLTVLAWVPVPVLLVGLYLSMGHLAVSRWEWEAVFYAVTDRRVMVRGGRFRERVTVLDLGDVVYFKLRPLGKDLGTLQIWTREGKTRVTLCCLEHPHRLTEHLEAAMAAAGNLARAQDLKSTN